MSPILKPKKSPPPTGVSLFAPVQRELSHVERILRKELRSEAPFVDQLIRHGCLLGGKRLRPALLLLAGKASGTLGDEHLILAAVVEMIHTATLIHDDVLDDATMRRHTPTVNFKWDNQASVLLGDFLFTHAFYLASTLGSTFACQTIGRATNAVCEGELRQVGSQGNFALEEGEYLEIIEAKTAELCACCCRLGAHYAGADPAVADGLGRYGRWLGIAFQIADDLLDMQGDESIAGKSLGSDLEKQKVTLPLIHVLASTEISQRQELISRLQNARGSQELMDELHGWFDRFDAFGYAHQLAARFAARARAELESLPDSAAKAALERLTEFVVERVS